MSARPVILDCDPGHDDAIALLLAAASDALDLRAITTVAGNGELDKVTFNAQRICTLADIRDVPIAAGAAGPLAGTLETAADVHGASALDGPALPDARRRRSTRAPRTRSSPTSSPRRPSR